MASGRGLSRWGLTFWRGCPQRAVCRPSCPQPGQRDFLPGPGEAQHGGMQTASQARGSQGDGRNRPPAVLTVASAIAMIGEPAVRWRLHSGRWQRPCRGVLVTHSGGISDAEWLWIAVLGAGPHALLGGLTAARLDGLTGFDDRGTHVLLPACRQVRTGLPGVVVHRSRVLGPDDVHPARLPPRTRLARSLLDAAAWSGSGDQGPGGAGGGGATTPGPCRSVGGGAGPQAQAAAACAHRGHAGGHRGRGPGAFRTRLRPARPALRTAGSGPPGDAARPGRAASLAGRLLGAGAPRGGSGRVVAHGSHGVVGGHAAGQRSDHQRPAGASVPGFCGPG